jgi:hypothetical protein
MHSVGRDKLNLTDAWQVPVSSRLKDLLITPEDHLVFCFGEIDCRCQLWKFRDKNLLVIIHDLVDSYLEGIYQLVNELPNLPASIWINCVPPASRIANSFQHPEFPYLGTDSEREGYTKMVNEVLKEKCQMRALNFFDLLEKHQDESGMLNLYLADDDGVHIRDPKYYALFINERFNSLVKKAEYRQENS